jgi:hypothetical protein
VRISPELEQKCLDLAGVKHEPEKFVDEKDFQAAVMKLAKRLGWRCYHTRDSRKSTAGFPDLVLVRDKVMFAELKAEDGKPTADQSNWLEAIQLAGSFAYLWRPSDWADIERLLT